MRFGFFDQLPCAPGFTEQQRYHDILAQIDLGDEVGFDTVWLGELHFSRAFSILADPLMLLAAASQRTSRIRLGTAVTLLPLHNPVKIAEEAAIVDLLSNGRLEFGVGRGTAPLHYEGYAVPMEESRERFDEALDFIIGAWTSEPFSFEGQYFQARELKLTPRPIQSPYPPIRIAANSPDTFPFAGRRGMPICDAERRARRHRPRLPGPCRRKPGGSSRASRTEPHAVSARGGRAVAAAKRRRREKLRGVSPGRGAHGARDLCRFRPRDGRLRRP